ncbi:MAG: exosortase/archaeosortase family protein [Euryarchaeota archaeon]|nr:exosortase/archaeosortase family protein [Euryarchaeota archaeon]
MNAKARRVLPYIAVLILAAMPVYGGLFAYLFREWTANDWARYGVFVPAMAFFIGYLRRDRVRLHTGVGTLERVLGLLVVIAALLAARSSGNYPVLLGLPFFAAGLFMMFYGFRDLKVMLPAFLFLFFLLPPQAQAADRLGYLLVQKEAGLAVGTLGSFIPVELSRNPGYMSAGLPGGGEFVFTPACSSGYILVPFILFSLFIALTAPGDPLRKLALALLALPLIFLLNSVRLAAILAIGYYLGSELAYRAFHLFGGLAIFLFFVVAYLAATTRRPVEGTNPT